MSQYTPSYGQPVGGVTWMGGAPRPKPLDRYTAKEQMMRAGDPQARRAEGMKLGLIPMDAPPQSQGGGGGGGGRAGRGGGGGPTFGFAPTNFSDGSRYNAEGYRADGRKKIQGFSADAAGLPDFGGLDQFYAQQDRSVPAFYNGSEDSTGQSAAEVAGRVQAKGNMLVPVGDEGLSMVEPRADGGPVTPGQPYLVGERGPELIVPQVPGQVIPNDKLKRSRPDWEDYLTGAAQGIMKIAKPIGRAIEATGEGMLSHAAMPTSVSGVGTPRFPRAWGQGVRNFGQEVATGAEQAIAELQPQGTGGKVAAGGVGALPSIALSGPGAVMKAANAAQNLWAGYTDGTPLATALTMGIIPGNSIARNVASSALENVASSALESVVAKPKTGIQARAEGGPVVAGQPYLVGERGPELIVPEQAGTVIPNDALPQRGTPGYLQIARGVDQYALTPFAAGMQGLGEIGYGMAEQTRDNMATLGNAVGTTAGFLREQPLKQGMRGLDWFVNGPQMVPPPAPVSKAGAPEMQRIGQQVDQWMQNAPPPTVAAPPPPSFMPASAMPAMPAPMLAPAAPLPPMQIGAPAMTGVTAPEMRPAPGWAAAGPQTGQVAQFMGPDPTVQYSSAPPTRSAGDMPTRLPPELAQAPALMPGMSYYQTRLAQRNFSRSPAGVQFFLNQQEYDRRNPQPAAPTAAAAPGMVPEGFMAVPKTFLPNGQVQSWGLQPKPVPATPEAPLAPWAMQVPGGNETIYGVGKNVMGTRQPTESPSRISQFLMTQVARAEKPETLRQLMNSTEDLQVIEAASKKLEKLAPKDSKDQIYRLDPVTNKLEIVDWVKGKKVPEGYQRMEDENNDGVPDAMQQQPQQPQGPATKTALDRYFSVRQ